MLKIGVGIFSNKIKSAGDKTRSEKFMNRLRNILIAIRNFFWWSAGVVPSVLEKCPTNHAKYTAIGVIMVFIALLASFSFAFFLTSTFSISFPAALPGGVLYGFLIYSLDRAILTSYRKDETGKISIVQRFLLTISLALIIGEPLLLQLFRKEIAFEMAQKSQVVSTDSRQKATARFQTEINSLENANREIQNRRDALKAERDEKENAVIGETEGKVGSGKKGYGEAAKLKEKAFTESDAKYKEYITDSAETLLQNRERLAQIRNEIEEEIRRVSAADTAADGILAKHAALFNIVKTQAGAALVYVPLFVGLLFCETLPLSIKVFGKKSVYDVALETEETETVENFEAEKNRRRNMQNAVADRIADSIVHETNLRDDGERKVAKKMKAEILRNIENIEAKAFNRPKDAVGFGAEITVEVVGQDDLQIKLQLPENVRREISLQELGGDIQTIAAEIGAEDLKLAKAFSSKGHEIWQDLPLLPQLESDQKLILQFAPVTTI